MRILFYVSGRTLTGRRHSADVGSVVDGQRGVSGGHPRTSHESLSEVTELLKRRDSSHWGPLLLSFGGGQRVRKVVWVLETVVQTVVVGQPSDPQKNRGKKGRGWI